MPEQDATDEARHAEPVPAEHTQIPTFATALPPLPSPVMPEVNRIQKKSALEKAALIMGMIVPIVLGLATLSLTKQQQQGQQQQYKNTLQEQDRSRAMDRLLALGDPLVNDRLAAAKALRSYADLNRMGADIVPGLLPYLKSECDETVFRIEKEAALQAAHNSSSQSQSSDGATTGQQPVTGIAAILRSPECPDQPAASSTAPPTTATTIVTAPPQYFEVGCSEDKTGILQVPVPGLASSSQVIQSVSASLANIDNLKAWTVRVLDHTDNSARIEYHLVGLDRQFLGNCPGGGHGSVVTSFVIGPK